ncbi:hypothetical protein DNTS_018412 [Danionella cerebrum]|uniref:B30.2/SPRY domain-containing protein n=1 Tax=Danionella cerebrum TaxID=2873325 RepID=A0A553Q5H6_9TELE|nr:hypothetical protein DNTS_018412 [Danionella translucida]
MEIVTAQSEKSVYRSEGCAPETPNHWKERGTSVLPDSVKREGSIGLPPNFREAGTAESDWKERGTSVLPDSVKREGSIAVRSKINKPNNNDDNLLTSVADKTLQCSAGPLDLFLRFLIGISLESNQGLLVDLLTDTESTSETIKEVSEFIKNKINCYNLSADRSISLFLCLLELKDQALCQEIQQFVKSDKHSESRLSPVQCSAMAYMIQMSEEVLEEFEPAKYNTSYEGRWRLIPAVMNCRRALLAGCCLSQQHCEVVCSALQSNPHLEELDLSNNDRLHDGVRAVCEGLKSSCCQLSSLRLAGCRLSLPQCESLFSALQSSKSLRELDLSNNLLKDSEVKLLCDGLRFAHELNSLSSSLRSSHSSLRKLDLSNNDLQDSGVTYLCDALKTTECCLQNLRLAGCRLTGLCCESWSSVLQSSNCCLQKLDLSNNDLQDSGVERLCAGLKSRNCHLRTLRLVICNFTAQSCKCLSIALQSSNSLRELDLSNNDLQDSGVQHLFEALKTPGCLLSILRLSGCMVTEESCDHVSSALASNRHLTELDLSFNHMKETGVFPGFQRHPHYAQVKLNLDHDGGCRIQQGLRKYACDLTLDPVTANNHLILSADNTKASYMEEAQPYDDNPERFSGYPQVLCQESLSGRCYWEVEAAGYAVISVAYKGISRKGWNEFSEFGYNGNNRNSWCLFWDDKFTVCHDYKEIIICVPSGTSRRLGVYLDWSAGTLSFYSVCNTLTHLHTFSSTFTEPLYAGFGVYRPNSSVKLWYK